MTESFEKQKLIGQTTEIEANLNDKDKERIRQEVEDIWFGRKKRRCGQKGHFCIDCMVP